eukprot:CAMPEP_0119125388 /NCGR_PEP_ID=MMETSP1310-20130426/4678_1 /TAXON_ID=464262 /ORGANISM="Genus nov. species nov., Strain RCC2339" /LENGTH=259 /DNA_ID=CAMNT_0007115449 /DNA_START=111 /DNA_END=890 /DNA_ORIENTATION=-
MKVLVVVLLFAAVAWAAIPVTTYHRYEVDEGIDTALDADCRQYRRLRGIGTQNYICKAVGDSGPTTYSWQLEQPFAYLHEYLDDGITTFISTEIAGFHSFMTPATVNSPASGPAWSLGVNCDIDSCDAVTQTWIGAGVVSSEDRSGFGNIAWLKVNRDDDETVESPGQLSQADFLQRLDTINGLPPTIDEVPCNIDLLGTQYGSPYECDYIFSVCGTKFEVEQFPVRNNKVVFAFELSSSTNLVASVSLAVMAAFAAMF